MPAMSAFAPRRDEAPAIRGGAVRVRVAKPLLIFQTRNPQRLRRCAAWKAFQTPLRNAVDVDTLPRLVAPIVTQRWLLESRVGLQLFN